MLEDKGMSFQQYSDFRDVMDSCKVLYTLNNMEYSHGIPIINVSFYLEV
jgi:hypothetical protein